jgi:ABC-type multidrug transport system fused ATPase/permease subunit
MKAPKRRTDEQIRHSVEVDKDFTGGYDFLPWLIFMRTYFTLFVVLFTITVLTYIIYSSSWVVLCFILPLFATISFLVKNEFNKDKKGIAR